MDNWDEADFGSKGNSMNLPTTTNEGKEGTKKEALKESKMDTEAVSSSPKKLGGKSKDGMKSGKTLGMGSAKKLSSGKKKQAALKQA